MLTPKSQTPVEFALENCTKKSGLYILTNCNANYAEHQLMNYHDGQYARHVNNLPGTTFLTQATLCFQPQVGLQGYVLVIHSIQARGYVATKN